MIYLRKFSIPEGSSGKEKHRLEHEAGLLLLADALKLECGLELMKTAGLERAAGVEAGPAADLAAAQTGHRNAASLSAVEAELAKDEKGKPYLLHHPEIHFNISHGGDMAVCAVGSQALGADVEKIRPARRSIIKKMLTDREKKHLESCREEEIDREFFRFWTLKESYAKALG
ncbi:MAG: 4'-phosphopantetheinyl transferase superfamily protein, partial [Lachnospiraceae bacterium]|nr:4'-phosphopantetheinyl transferase superfamily protein [Lachnospiraceae bacterium]